MWSGLKAKLWSRAPVDSSLPEPTSAAATTPGTATLESERNDVGDVIRLSAPATDENFEEAGYLEENPDIRSMVRGGMLPSGWAHFDSHGRHEGRRIRRATILDGPRKLKIDRLRPFLRDDLPYSIRDGRPDYLSDTLRAATGISETENVSSNGYDGEMLDLIARHSEGLVLDCGAGRRDTYYRNVVNFEIVAYDSTDVLGVGEELPFRDNTFDAVLSVAVLEHVRDPFRCASEIARVLKPDGELLCVVPFLQPQHGYPHHYFNATQQGLRRLFEETLNIDSISVPEVGHPAYALRWILQSWADGLPPDGRQAFLDQTIGDILGGDAARIAAAPYGALLSKEKRFELACCCLLKGRKES